MVGTRRLIQLKEIASAGLQLPENPLVVALSGGADSAALAWLVADSNRRSRGLHVDHGLTHSPTMRAAAEEIAERLNLELMVTETRVGSGPSPEGQARTARYQAFEEASTEEEALLTAHTAEDNVETVLINLVRGTGIKGLAGIPRFRPPNIHRPVLDVSRGVLRELATLAGLPFVDDPMNLDTGLTRNRIRQVILPRLQEINPSLADTMARTSRMLGADADLLDEMAGSLVPSVGPEGTIIPIGVLKSAPRPTADRVLMAMLLEQLDTSEVTANRLDRIWEVAWGLSQRQQIAAGVEVWADGPFLVVGSPNGPDNERPLAPGEHRHAGLIFEVIRVEEVCRVAPLSRWHAIFPKETILTVGPERTVLADGEPAWIPGEKRLPVGWYEPGTLGYLSVFAREESGWTSNR